MNNIQFVKYDTDGRYIRAYLIEKILPKPTGGCIILTVGGDRLVGDISPKNIVSQIHSIGFD